MARHTEVRLIDDMDGSAATGTIEFALEGRSYEMDLSTAHAEQLRNALAPFIASARRSSGRTNTRRAMETTRSSTRPGNGATPQSDRDQNQAIREWAAARGMKIADRGRIKKEILDAYHASSQGIQASVTPSAVSPVPGDGPAITTTPPAPETVVELPADKPEGGATVHQMSKAKRTKAKDADMVEGEYTPEEVEAWCQSKGKPIKKHANGTIKGLHLFRQAMVRDIGPKMVAQTG